MYYDISDRLTRVDDGKPVPIPPTQLEAWARLSGRFVTPTEYGILSAMDKAYCAELAKELADYRARRRAEDEAAAKTKPKRGFFRRG